MAKATLKVVKRSASSDTQKAPSAPVKTGTGVSKLKAGVGQPPTSGRMLGITSGMSIAKYQNETILHNLRNKLTDDQLAADWRREFPNAKADYSADTVRGVRNLVNLGKHGNEMPRQRIPQFDDAGQPMLFRGDRKAAREDARAQRESARVPAPAAKKGVVVKGGTKGASKGSQKTSDRPARKIVRAR